MSSKQRGSIYKRGDGRWCAALRLEDGRRKIFYGWKKAEVQDKLDAAKMRIKQGTFAKGRSPRLEDFLTTWLRDTVKPTVRPSTYRSYCGLMQTHVIPRLGKVTLEELTPQHVQQLLNAMVGTAKSATTAGHVRSVLRTALNQARKWRLIVHNAAADADPPMSDEAFEPNPLTSDEVHRLMDVIASTGDRLAALYVVAIATALRQGELLGLTWRDVDLEQGVLYLRRQMQRVDGHLELVELKSKSSRGTATLTADAIEALKAHEALQRLEKLAERKRWKETGLVFTTRIGTPLEGTNVTKAFQKLLKQADISKRRFHDLRHTTPTLMRKQGVDMKVLQTIMRHSSYKLTADTYGHVLPELQRDAAERLQALLQR